MVGDVPTLPVVSARQIVVRVAWIGTSSLLSVVGLVAFFAWLALNVRWEIPDPAALTAPTTIRAADGTVLARLTSEVDRRIVPIDEVSRAALDAIVASEDARFYEHEGVDPFALLRAVVSNVRTGAIAQGGSTLTQQYVKNAFTGGERSIWRKVQEAVISIQLKRDLSKQEILEEYVNTVYFGEGAYGIEAAALTYFGVHASELNVAQGAALAQLLPAPSRWNPRVDPQGSLERRDAVIRRMGDLGTISPSRVARATVAPLEVLPRRRPPTRYPFFVQYVRKQLVDAYGEPTVLTGGLDVRTTLQPRVQEVLAEAVAERLPPDEAPIDAGVVAVDPRTGAIIGSYGGRDFRARQFDLGLSGLRQPGSTFKSFVYLAALEQDVSPRQRYSGPRSVSIGGWDVSNVGGASYGSIDISRALQRSVNTVYAQLGRDVGAEHTALVASRMGVRSRRLSTSDITIALGTYEVSPLDMASAYGTLANDGIACPAHAIAEVVGPDGQRLPPPRERVPSSDVVASRPDDLGGRDDGRCYEALDADVARTTTETLEGVVSSSGTAPRADIGRPQAGKTGTSQNNSDAWFVGYTPQLSLAVWVGHPDRRVELEDIGGFRQVYGGTIPALIWRDAAEAILEDAPALDFLEPGELTRGGRRVRPPMSRSDGDDGDGDDDAGATPAPSPTPSPTGTGSEGPSEQPSPSESEPTDDGDDGDGDEGDCIPLVTCDDPPG